MAEYFEKEILCDWCLKTGPSYCDKCVMNRHDLPAADVRPVVRGHIEEDENSYLFCSECNCNITLAIYETPNGNLVLRPNYCPNCGGKICR